MTIELNKKALCDEISEKTGSTKKVTTEIVEATFETIKEILSKGGKVDIYGFGKFEVKERAARNGINPVTKEHIKISATKVPSFRASKSLKEAVK